MKINRERLVSLLKSKHNHISGSFFSGPFDGDGIRATKKYFNEFEKNILGFPQLDVIEEGLNKLSAIDWLLCFTSKRYRDHSRHVWDVALLGMYLLEVEVKYNDHQIPLWQFIYNSTYNKCKEEVLPDTKNNKPFVELSWWIAAIFHDHAYPLSHILNSTEKFLGMSKGKEPISKHSISSIESILRSFGKLYYFGFKNLIGANSTSKSFRSRLQRIHINALSGTDIKNHFKYNIYDHGLCSATNLAKLLKSWLQSNNEFADHFKVVLQAIVSHSSDDTIKMHCKPLSWLLAVCDEVQEWNRKVASEHGVRSEIEKIEIEGINEDKDNMFFDEELIFTFFTPDKKTSKITGWDIDKFKASKSSNFKRLRVPENFYPRYVRIQIKSDFLPEVKFRIDMSTGEEKNY